MDVNLNLYLFALIQWVVPSEQKLLFSKKKDGLYFRRIFNVPVQYCMKECLARSLCHSINYHRASKTCELNKAVTYSSGLNIARGWVYSEKSSFANIEFTQCKCPVGKTCVVAPEETKCVFEECEKLTGRGRSNMVTVGARTEHSLLCVSDITQFDAYRDSSSNLFPLVCTSEGTWSIETESSCYAVAFTLNSNTNFDPYIAWLRGDNSRSDIECLASTNCQNHYRNNVIEIWNHLPISKIRFSIFKNKQEVQYIVFDGNNSMYTDWFSHARVTDSSWLDLVTTATKIEAMKVVKGYFFSLQGHELGNRMRRFFISELYNGCPGDQGWFTAMFVSNYDLHLCKWEKQSGISTFFLYSVQEKVDVFGNANNADHVYIMLDLKVPSKK